MRPVTMPRRVAALAALAPACAVLLSSGAWAQKSGKALFEECAACHALTSDAKPDDNTVGPNLHGVFGRKAGSRDDFRYSGPMKRSTIVWTRETIDQLIANPQGAVPGTRMPFSGMPDAAERKALLDYLELATK